MKKDKANIGINIFFVIFSMMFIIPFLLILAVSFTSESAIAEYGYSLFPKEWSLEAYKYVFSNPTRILNSYKTTIIFTVIATVGGVLVMALIAYPLSRDYYVLRRPITFIIFFTMLFSGGLVPSYMLITKTLKLGNNILVYILPSLANAWHIVIIRTFFQGIPKELVESAKIDGARELRIFFGIIIPLSKPVLATIAMLTMVGKWNDWMHSMLYITDPELYSLQYLLQKILRETEFIKSMASEMQVSVYDDMSKNLPDETMRFAMAVIAAGPMLVVFPFFQKYFVKGLTVGSVKG